jgi:serine/threonine protein kinase
MLYQAPGIRPDAIESEIKAISQLCDGKHHNLVQLFGFGQIKEMCFYIDMELCDSTLTDYIVDKKMVDGLPCFGSLESSLKVQQIWNIITQIADGVKFIHERKHVHRDLKPNNSDSQVY